MRDAASVTHSVPNFFRLDNHAPSQLVPRIFGIQGRRDTLYTRNSSKMSFAWLENIYCGIKIPCFLDNDNVPLFKPSLPKTCPHIPQKANTVSGLYSQQKP